MKYFKREFTEVTRRGLLFSIQTPLTDALAYNIKSNKTYMLYPCFIRNFHLNLLSKCYLQNRYHRIEKQQAKFRSTKSMAQLSPYSEHSSV